MIKLCFLCVFRRQTRTRKNWTIWSKHLQPCPVRDQHTAKSASNFKGEAANQTNVNFCHQTYSEKQSPSHPTDNLWISWQASAPSSQETSQERENVPSLAAPESFGYHPSQETTAGQWTPHIQMPSQQLLFHTSLCLLSLISISSFLAFFLFSAWHSVLLYSELKGPSVICDNYQPILAASAQTPASPFLSAQVTFSFFTV